MTLKRLKRNHHSHLLLNKELSTIKLSSKNETISEVSAPFKRSSPRFLNEAKENSCELHSATTWANFASMSFSLTAEIQISWKKKEIEDEMKKWNWKNENGKWKWISVENGAKQKQNGKKWGTILGILWFLLSTAKQIYLDVLLILEKWCLHNISQLKVLVFYIKLVSR